MNLLQRFGDWLGIHGSVIVAGSQPRWYLRSLLRHYGVSVLYITKHRAQHAPWWAFWAVDTMINVGRYEDFVAAQILADNGYTVHEPDPTGGWTHVPRGYQHKLNAIEARRVFDQRATSTGVAHRKGRPAWQRAQ